MEQRSNPLQGLTLRRAVSDALVAGGYKHVKVGVHLKPIAGNFKSVVDTGPLDGYGDIAPAVGLRHESVEHLLSELEELPFYRHTATVVANVGEILGGQYRAWRDPTAPSEVIDSIERAVEEMHKFASLERLPEAWRYRRTLAEDTYTLVSIYLILEDTQRVRELLAEGENAFCQEDNAICEQFRHFQRNVQRRLAKP